MDKVIKFRKDRKFNKKKLYIVIAIIILIILESLYENILSNIIFVNFPPSSGKIGIKLKDTNIMFILLTIEKVCSVIYE